MLKQIIIIILAICVSLSAMPMAKACTGMKDCPAMEDCMATGCQKCVSSPAVLAHYSFPVAYTVKPRPAILNMALPVFYPEPQSPPPKIA